MKAYIFCESPLGSDYSGKGMYAIITEKEETIYKIGCSSRIFANHDLTVWIDKELQEKGVTEVYSNGVVVWKDGKLTEGVASAFLAEERYYELINSDAI